MAGLLDRSRIIGMLRLALPLTALGLLSMVFLLASPVDPTRALATAEIDVADRARDPRLSQARFAGVTDDGAAIRIEAGAARSDPGAALRFAVEGFELSLDGAAGEQLTARSDTGRLDRTLGTFDMSGNLTVTAGPDQRLTAARLNGQLDRTRIEATGPVTGQAIGGEVTAGHLTITADQAAPGSYRLVFQQGVRFIYHPAE